MVTVLGNSVPQLLRVMPSFLMCPLGGAPLLGKGMGHLQHRPVF